MKVRACLGCGVPTMNGSRCMDCARQRSGFAAGFRKGPRAPTYDETAWRKLSKRLRAEWVARNGWYCPGWNRGWHASRDLTGDHIVPLMAGGAALDPANVRILCRACNARAGLSAATKARAAKRRAAS